MKKPYRRKLPESDKKSTQKFFSRLALTRSPPPANHSIPLLNTPLHSGHHSGQRFNDHQNLVIARKTIPTEETTRKRQKVDQKKFSRLALTRSPPPASHFLTFPISHTTLRTSLPINFEQPSKPGNRSASTPTTQSVKELQTKCNGVPTPLFPICIYIHLIVFLIYIWKIFWLVVILGRNENPNCWKTYVAFCLQIGTRVEGLPLPLCAKNQVIQSLEFSARGRHR